MVKLYFVSLFALVLSYAHAQEKKPFDTSKISIAVGIENYNFKPLFAQFTEQSGVAVELLAFDNNDLKSQLIQKANAASLPDIVIVPSDYIGLEQLNFSTVPEAWINKSINIKAKQSSLLNSTYAGIPFIFGNHLMLYYNKKWVKSPPETWRDIFQLIHHIPKSKSLITWNYLEMYWYIAFYNAHDKPIISNHLANLSTTEMANSIELYQKLRQDVGMAVNCNYACMTSSFESETSVMAINGTWIFDKWLALFGEDLGVVALPSLEGRPMRPYYSSHVLAFPNNSLDGAKRSDIKKLSQFVQSEAVQKQVWSQLKALPVRDDVLDTLAHAQPDVVTLMAGLKYALPMPNDIEMAYVWEAMLKGITRYEAGIMSSTQAADYMQYIANKSITHAQQKYSH